MREGLWLRLERENDFLVVGEAANAADACAGVRATRPDLVLMDINLPGESGLGAIARIRRDFPTVKVIALTGGTESDAAQNALLAGANGFLRKEEAGDELIRAVRLVLQGKVYLSPDAAAVLTEALLHRTALAAPGLTGREIEVLQGLADGLSYKQIADRMKLGQKSIETYRARLVKKIGVSSRAEITRYAVRNGYTSL